MLADKVSSWRMQADGSYLAPTRIIHPELAAQEILMSKALKHLTVSS
jgi:hypothetical protein